VRRRRRRTESFSDRLVVLVAEAAGGSFDHQVAVAARQGRVRSLFTPAVEGELQLTRIEGQGLGHVAHAD
jgi:hypothetical protein